MNKKDLNDIGTLIDQRLDEKLEPIHRKLDQHTAKLDEHDGKFKSINQHFEEVNQKLDSLTLDMTDVQGKTDVLKDIQSYMEGTREKVENHEQRIQNLENAA